MGSLCTACSAGFLSRARLVRRLSRSGRCFQALLECDPLGEEAFASAEAQTVVDRRAPRRAGTSIRFCFGCMAYGTFT